MPTKGLCQEHVIFLQHMLNNLRSFLLQVEEMRSKDDSKESHIILEECLQDNDWIENVSCFQ